MKRFQTLLAAVLLALTSLSVQAQAPRVDELATDAPATAQERRQERAARDGVPSLRDVNQTARDGDLPKARAMVDQILQRSPDNARAHFVKAQLAARDRDFATARAELETAERLAPGLPFAREQQVTRLRSRLERLEAREGAGGQRRAGRNAREDTTARPAEAPVESPSSSTTAPGSSTTPSNSTPPVETRPAGEDTRNMGASAPRAAEPAGNSMLMGVLIGGGVVAVLAALLFRRRRPTQV